MVSAQLLLNDTVLPTVLDIWTCPFAAKCEEKEKTPDVWAELHEFTGVQSASEQNIKSSIDSS